MINYVGYANLRNVKIRVMFTKKPYLVGITRQLSERNHLQPIPHL
jgi:hypothetical protein